MALDKATKEKLAMTLSLLVNEFNQLKKNGQFKECIGIEKAIDIIKKVFK
jgi:hypothetical protein